ncbi:MAG: DUF1565 domain-containing protein, partial [Treponema sp.]|nr:DUF1565 domain-containing protein [Treponema sp.]
MEYFVKTTGSDFNDGTASAPFKTISKAAAVAQAGDIVTVFGGTYREWARPQNGGRSPYELYHDVLKATIAPPPHATYQDEVIIADAQNRYMCFSGMWWVEKNHLAYMEPLCTVPKYRKMGLAS